MVQTVTVLIIVLLIAVDQAIKLLVLKHLSPLGSYILIDKFISLTFVKNTGAAFGSFSGYTAVLSVITALVLIVGLIYLLSGKIKPKILYVPVVMIVSGGAANLIDRIFRGYVIDYIEPLFVDFAVFNFADMLITVGAFIIIIYLCYDLLNDAQKGKKDESYEQH